MVMPVGCCALTLSLAYKGFDSGKKVLAYVYEYSWVDYQARSTNERLLWPQDCGLPRSSMIPRSQPSHSKAGSKTKVVIDVG